MTVAQAKEIVKQPVTTQAERALFMQALKLLSGSWAVR